MGRAKKQQRKEIKTRAHEGVDKVRCTEGENVVQLQGVQERKG